MVSDWTQPRRHRRSRRQRRLAVLGAGAASAFFCGLVLAVHGGASSGVAHLTVHQGDTLWAIAASHYAGQDIQSRVAEIEADNHLAGAALSPGQVLRLPAP